MAPTNAELLKRNEEYAPTHKPMPLIDDLAALGRGAPQTAVITCVDPRVLPDKLLGLNVGECFIFRTVAGHPQPALEDLSSLDIETNDGVKDVMIIYHTDCGSLRFEIPRIEEGYANRAPEHRSHVGQNTPFGAVDKSNVDETIRNDVKWLKAQPLMRKGEGLTVGGYLYDIMTGKLRQIV